MHFWCFFSCKEIDSVFHGILCSKNVVGYKHDLAFWCSYGGIIFFISSFSLMCSSRKYPYSPHRMDWNFLGVGVSKTKTMYQTYWNL